jgi:hypothetical protein
MADRAGAPNAAHVKPVGFAALTLAIVAIFYLGILPTSVMNFAAESIATIF